MDDDDEEEACLTTPLEEFVLVATVCVCPLKIESSSFLFSRRDSVRPFCG